MHQKYSGLAQTPPHNKLKIMYKKWNWTKKRKHTITKTTEK
jgi:hypothetical protein